MHADKSPTGDRATKSDHPPKLHFVFFSENGQIVPTMPVFESTTNNFINDAWVTIQINREQVKIIDAQNWDKQKFSRIQFHDIGRPSVEEPSASAYMHVYDARSGVEVQPSVIGFLNKFTGERHMSYAFEKDVVNISRYTNGSISVTNAMGPMYIIIHDLTTGRIDIYKRAPGSLSAEHLDAFVTLRDIHQTREEYGEVSFSQFDLLVKRKIAEKLLQGGSGTIRYCQTDRGTRRACQLLPIETKINLCFERQHGLARQCDKIPAFTKAEFEELIPKDREVREDDELLFSHDYYPRRYKLATEGFSEAMYKARWINTICAIARVQMFLEYSDLIPPLPIYVDRALIQEAVTTFDYVNATENTDDYRVWTSSSVFAATFTFSDGKGYGFRLILNQYYSGHSTDDMPFKLWSTEGQLLQLKQTQQVYQVLQDLQADPLVKKYRNYIDQRTGNGESINFLHLMGITPIAPPNVFAISRVVKIFLDNGFGYSITAELE
jgi:hypothetical protein